MKIVREMLDERKLNFSQTIKAAKKGPLRKKKYDGGWYVVGEEHIINAKDEADADEILKKMKKE